MRPTATTETSASAARASLAGEPMLLDTSGAVHFPRLGLLCVSDMHLEKGSSFAARRGLMLPPYDSVATLARLRDVIARHAPTTVVSLGDSFHDRHGAERLTPAMRDTLEELAAGRDWYWVAGNHDPEPPAGVPGEAVRELTIAGLVFRHEPSGNATQGEIAGHQHPCARIVQRGRSLRRRCFASDGERLVMPAFGAYTGSLNVLDRAYAGLFSRAALIAYVIGASRVFSIAGTKLQPG